MSYFKAGFTGYYIFAMGMSCLGMVVDGVQPGSLNAYCHAVMLVMLAWLLLENFWKK